mmetsp:Transcript_72002/g.154057  ORF Transcript_72002/g.154057 Transcript_72002/m.154057 type:complete len:1029 (+) Transcript_72002:89-3175(+)
MAVTAPPLRRSRSWRRSGRGATAACLLLTRLGHPAFAALAALPEREATVSDASLPSSAHLLGPLATPLHATADALPERGAAVGDASLPSSTRALGQLGMPLHQSSLFCFTLVMPSSFEAPLLAAHRAHGVGIFDCDGHMVFSNVSAKRLFGDAASQVRFSVIHGSLASRRGPENSYLNAGNFVKVWDMVIKQDLFRQYDWTLKVDVDAILVPRALRGLLSMHCLPPDCGPLYLRDSSGHLGLHGPIEVLSQAAMKYFAATSDNCGRQIDFYGKTEAEYLSMCLDSLKIKAELETNLLRSGGLDAGDGPECDKVHAAFHPFKSWAASLRCLEETGRRSTSGVSRQPLGSSAAGEIVAQPSLFCISVVLPKSYEAILVAEQYVQGVGIFDCDEYMLFSNVSRDALFAPGVTPGRWPAGGPALTVMPGNLEVPRGGKSLTALNSGVFIKVWHRIFQDGQYKAHDWSLKFDPDVVFVPGQLRQMLSSHCPSGGGKPCGVMYLSDSGHLLHGPVEALTRGAMEVYARGAERCAQEVDYREKGEGWYLSLCLQLLGVAAVQEPGLLSDDFDDEATPACNARHAAFHPFKMWEDYLACLEQAGYYVGRHVASQDAWALPSPLMKPSLFCWTLVQASGPEPRLLQRQHAEGVGIFSCDGHLVISNASSEDVFGPLTSISIALIDADLFTPRGGQYYTALNSPVFIKAWSQVFHDGRFREHDWTLKLDCDAVIVPQRLRQVLQRHCHDESCGPKFLSNFGWDLHGPVEVINRRGMEVYAHDVDRCVSEVDFSDKGEDWYLGLCMALLEVPSEEEASLLSDWHFDGGAASPCDTLHAAFHPFKLWDDHMACLCQTGYSTAACRTFLLATSTSTSTSTTRTTTSTSTSRTTTTAMTSTTTTRDAHSYFVLRDRFGDGGHRHRGPYGGKGPHGGALRGWLHLPHAADFGGGVPIAVCVGLAGTVVGLGLGLVAVWGSRKLRSRRLFDEPMAAALRPTSLSEPAEVRVMESGQSMDSCTSCTSQEALIGPSASGRRGLPAE